MIDILSSFIRKLNVYSDFRKDLLINPISSDIALKQNEDSVKEALKNLILTDKGERLFQPNIGSDIRKSLFDNMTPASIKVIEQNVKNTINNFEPRVTLISVDVTPDFDNYKIKIDISFYVRNVQTPVTVSVFLERTR